MATIVSFINYKGGVGKTTLSVEMACSLAYHKNKRVLLADLDPQTNATFYLISNEKWEEWAKENGTLREIFSAAISKPAGQFDLNKAILKNFVKHPRTNEVVSLDLLPSHLKLMTIDMDLAMRFGAQGLEGRRILKDAFDQIKANYDYIICDCPPNLNLITQNAILASDAIMIVAMPEYLSTLGIAEIEGAVRRTIDEVNCSIKGYGSVQAPKIKGIIFNRVSTQTGGTDNEKGIMQRVATKKGWEGLVFEEFISRSTKMAQSAEPSRSPIAISGYAADKVYENQLKKCADEFIQRLEQ
jgi:chromosome partitioning protein